MARRVPPGGHCAPRSANPPVQARRVTQLSIAWPVCCDLFAAASVARLTMPSDQAADAHEHGTEQANPRLALNGQHLQFDEGRPQQEANAHASEQAAPKVRGVERPMVTPTYRITLGHRWLSPRAELVFQQETNALFTGCVMGFCVS